MRAFFQGKTNRFRAFKEAVGLVGGGVVRAIKMS